MEEDEHKEMPTITHQGKVGVLESRDGRLAQAFTPHLGL